MRLHHHQSGMWAALALLSVSINAFRPPSGSRSQSYHGIVSNGIATGRRHAAPTAHSNRHGLRSYGRVPSDDDGYRDNANGNNNENQKDNRDDDDDEAIQSARNKLEALLPNHGRSSSTTSRGRLRPDNYFANPTIDSNSVLHPDNISHEIFNPPPLTTIGRTRRQAEIDYLWSLLHSDDALTDLWALWFSERGPDAAKELRKMEQLVMSMGDSPAEAEKWSEVETGLRALIEEHGVYWSEPMNQLATLLCQQGRYQESKELFEVVLAVKPWHFGAQSQIILCCDGLGDVTSARLYSDRKLPPLHDTTGRRLDWVERAVSFAKGALDWGEDRLQKDFEDCGDDAG